jgi:DNA polymerase-4
VCSSREAKSISVEETYPLDLPDLNACRQQLPGLLAKLSQRIERAQRPARARKLFLKIRFADFQQTTVECLGEQLNPTVFEKILETGFGRRDLPVRLLGVGIRLCSDRSARQLDLFH